MIRTLVQRTLAALTSPRVVAIAATVATVGAAILNSAVEGAKAELQKLDEQLAARDAELKDVLELLRRADAALIDGDVDEQQAVLQIAGDRYPAPEDVDPLERAGA